MAQSLDMRARWEAADRAGPVGIYDNQILGMSAYLEELGKNIHILNISTRLLHYVLVQCYLASRCRYAHNPIL